MAFASSAGGLRNRNAAVFVSLKKYAPHFFNTALGGTKTKNAANPVTGGENRAVVAFKCSRHSDWSYFILRVIYLITDKCYSTCKMTHFKLPLAFDTSEGETLIQLQFDAIAGFLSASDFN